MCWSAYCTATYIQTTNCSNPICGRCYACTFYPFCKEVCYVFFLGNCYGSEECNNKTLYEVVDCCVCI